MTDNQVLQSLVLLYFSPETADNQALRQCLTYFIPVYCYSSPDKQRRMLTVGFHSMHERVFVFLLWQIFSDTFEMLSQLHEEFEEEQMLPLAQMGLMMVDWLDPLKAVSVQPSDLRTRLTARERDGVRLETGLHLSLGVEILKMTLVETTSTCFYFALAFLSRRADYGRGDAKIARVILKQVVSARRRRCTRGYSQIAGNPHSCCSLGESSIQTRSAMLTIRNVRWRTHRPVMH